MNKSSVRTLGIIALVALVVICTVGLAFSPTLKEKLFPGIRSGETADSGQGSVLVSDDFSSPQWGTATTPDNSVEYANSALQMIVHAQNSFVWSPLNNLDYQNIHMEVTVINNGTDSTTAYGLICNKQGNTESFYYLAITPAGQYAIAKATQGENDVFLTNDDQWGPSDLIAIEAPSYRVGADCGHGTLTLYVDGQQIASVSDASYVSGGVALFTWSGEDATSTDVSFDDFLMTELP